MKKFIFKKLSIAGFRSNTIGTILLATVVNFNCTAWGIYELSQTTSDPNAGSYRVFVTSILTLGDMNFNNAYPASCPSVGIANANCVCEQLAISAGITTPTTTYRAWLSSDSGTASAAICNIQGVTGTTTCGNMVAGYSYVNTAGQTVFNSWEEITTNGQPVNPVYYDESGFPYDTNVWTGSNNFGYFISTSTCLGWTANTTAGSGATGSSVAVPPMWSNFATSTCDIGYPIYCFEGPL